MKMEDAKKATDQLIGILDEVEALFHETKETKKEYDFYQDIEPFVNRVYMLAERWKTMVLKELNRKHIRYIGSAQIEQVADNMNQLCVMAFQHTASLKRFKDHHQSTSFLLTSIRRNV